MKRHITKAGLRVTLLTLNGLLIFTGVVLFLVVFSTHDAKRFRGTISEISPIVNAVLLPLFGTVGTVGVGKMILICLKAYCMCCGIGICCNVIFGSISSAHVEKNWLQTLSSLEKSFENYYKVPSIANSVDALQKSLKCCGLHGAWQEDRGPVPRSCFDNQSKQQFIQGCADASVRNALYTGIGAIFVPFFTTLVFIVALTLTVLLIKKFKT
ncbi:unnamed protein product [Dicrocoelium dendriticum]|nr:unnamed protein product [Dicrocoelium dendriticum]